MAKTDMASNVQISQSINPQAVTGDVTGGTVDAQGYEAVTFVLSTGAYTDGEYAVLLEESDTGSSWAAIEQGSGLLINEENFPYSEDAMDFLITGAASQNTNFWIGYAGPKRYVRMRIYETMAMTGMLFSCACILGDPHSAPTSGVGN